MKTNTVTDDYLNQILRLQLKKPKTWNWELTTSKSSPNISLPTIQLYNSKGKLLVETKDNGDSKQSWKSQDNQPQRHVRPIRKSKSDLLDLTRENTPKTKRELKTYTSRSKSANLPTPYKPLDRYRITIDDKLKDQIDALPITKSRSTNFETLPKPKCKRSSSDDLYERILKMNEQKYLKSSMESIKRATEDGYHSFLNPQLQLLKERLEAKKRMKIQEEDDKKLKLEETTDPVVLNSIWNDKSRREKFEDIKKRAKPQGEDYMNHKLDDMRNEMGSNLIRNEKGTGRKSKDKKSILKKSDAISQNFNTEATKPEINRVKHSKYITRTCSAGTLVIKEESFSSPNARRRRRTTDEVQPFKLQRPSQFYAKNHVGDYNLFQSKSDVFPFDKMMEVSNGDCDYLVEEPESRKNSEQAALERDLEKLKRRYGRRVSDQSLSSEFGGYGGDQDHTTRVIKEHNKDSRPSKDVDLLRLVHRLSKETNNNNNNNNDATKMGANVSRHSAKGLSGRRSQSSGSICNGKGQGRHSDGKMCGSLPSYLDDGGCNNNVDECDKAEEARIPPLDGAPLHWKFSDNQTALCDQGYGSERSPEEEYPPPLPEHDNQCHHHLDLHSCYPFITPESSFTVNLSKGSRGLGLSVTGGVDSGGSWPGLIRVKRLFPHQPAACSEMLNIGDLILEANGITLTGLTNYEALEVLRTAPNQVELKICRPPPDVLSCVSPISEVPPPPPRRDPPSSLTLGSCSDDEHCQGDFEITMRKIQGSLGFTLRKEDDSALGHYIRALVREPALTDGRIQAGDKIIAVNDVEISEMTHEEAVQFLRQSGEVVKLRLYRDLAQTPVATLSPTETTPRTSFSKKTQLRQEAVDMLNDIAVRKLIPGNQEQYRRSLSPNSSPRRLRRQTCPSDASQASDSSRNLITDEQFHEGLLKNCSLPLDDESFNSLFLDDDDSDRLSRPTSLELYNPNQTPVAARKPKFNFSLAHNAYELNNLDAEILDAPNLTYTIGDDVNSTEVECGDSFPQEPASMPHIPLDNPGFSYKNPAYQSAHPQCCTEVQKEDSSKGKVDDSNMKKWKGVVFTADEERERQKVLEDDGFKRSEENMEILAIELNRGWNSRLGFSLQGAAGVTYVSAVHADSVAARDGRIRPGDRLIKVNDENVENMTTNEIIDLLRIVRGPVCIIVSRVKNKQDCMMGK